MYVARMLQEALLRNAIQIWLRLEEKLSAQLTDEVSRRVHLYFYVDSYCGAKSIFQRYALRRSLFYVFFLRHRYSMSFYILDKKSKIGYTIP